MIEIYTTTNCPHCETAKQYLREKGFTFQVKDVNKDKAYRKELLSKGYRGVPIIVIDNVDIVGFDKEKINQILKL